MKTQYTPILLLLILAILNTMDGSCQGNTFTKNFAEAENKFRDGYYPEAENLIIGENDKALNRKDRERKYQLLSQISIELARPDQLHSYLCKIIHNNPLYTPPSTGLLQQDFILQFKTFEVTPMISLGLGAGTNLCYVRKTQQNTVYQDTENTETTKGNWGNQVELFINFHFPSALTFQSGATLANYSYTKASHLRDSFKTNFTESLQYIGIPVILKLALRKAPSKFTINLNIGVKNYFLIQSSADIEIEMTKLPATEESIVYTKPTTLTNITTDKYRRKNITDLVGGITLEYKKERLAFGLSMNYQYGLSNVVNSDGLSIAEENLSFYYYHNDDYFKLNSINASFYMNYTLKYRIRPKEKC